MSKEFSYPKNKIKILLLENIHQVAVAALKEAGYSVKEVPQSLSPEQLLEEIKDAHVLGIRSKTKINREHFAAATKLLAVGCFGVGTNQVDLVAAREHGVPVFNAPYGNTRSVAELSLGNIIMLARKAADRNVKMHQGQWNKTAKGCHEVRHKTLGIIGYGHIGQQLGLLAEAIGMDVIFYDMAKRLPLGNAKTVSSMEDLLGKSDFVSLHVPAKKDGSALIGATELAKMKKGSYLLNLSRGNLIDFDALKSSVENKHLSGAAIDVYPQEPKTNDEEFKCALAGVENIILTPHLGGSTEEAQYNIGEEVAASFIKLVDGGATMGAVNFPQLDSPSFEDSHRILNIHKNVPGVLTTVNKIISDLGANVSSQFLKTYENVGYLIMDVDKELSEEVTKLISDLDFSIKTRVLY